MSNTNTNTNTAPEGVPLYNDREVAQRTSEVVASLYLNTANMLRLSLPDDLSATHARAELDTLAEMAENPAVSAAMGALRVLVESVLIEDEGRSAADEE